MTQHTLLLSLTLLAGLLGCGDDRDGAPASACEACADTEDCVQLFDGACASVVRCVTRVSACATDACTPACEQARCNGGDPQGALRCQAAPCGTELADAFHCYGP
ncbi:MAG: hypothetical protein R3B48_16590 [Kofleriaceae bacterium]